MASKFDKPVSFKNVTIQHRHASRSRVSKCAACRAALPDDGFCVCSEGSPLCADCAPIIAPELATIVDLIDLGDERATDHFHTIQSGDIRGGSLCPINGETIALRRWQVAYKGNGKPLSRRGALEVCPSLARALDTFLGEPELEPIPEPVKIETDDERFKRIVDERAQRVIEIVAAALGGDGTPQERAAWLIAGIEEYADLLRPVDSETTAARMG